MNTPLSIAPRLALSPDALLCAHEPIHCPDAIQPHGAVLAVDADGMITHASVNLLEMLEREDMAVLGRPLAAVVGAGAAACLQDGGPFLPRAGPFCEVLGRQGRRLRARAFAAGDYRGVDFEMPAPDGESALLTQAQALWAGLAAAPSQAAFCARAVNGLKAVTGYNRVMAYRFDSEGHGEVIAEALDTALLPYLGLHYPASDIPEQARRLFLRQRVGAIADADYRPVPLGAGAGAAPLDLSYSALRSVSPVHRAYMRNMGTAASLTIALVVEDRLWGMLVCHHATPRLASPDMRAVADMTSELASMMLAQKAVADTAARRAAGQSGLAGLAARLALGLDLAEALAVPALPALVGAAGAAIRIGGRVTVVGETPGIAALGPVFDVLVAAADDGLVQYDDLALRFPQLAACGQLASGVLLAALPPGTGDAILFCRPEQIRTVAWGGDPSAHVTRDPVTDRLAPRTSFAAWEESVCGRAAPWAPGDLDLAGALLGLIGAERASRARAELAALRHELTDRSGREDAGLPGAALLEAAPDAMVALTDAGIIVAANQRAAQHFGYPAQALAGLPVTTILPGFAPHTAPPAGGLQAGQILELAGRRQDGSQFSAEITISELPGSAPPLRLAAIRNISVRKNAERHTQTMEARYRSLLEASPDVMVMVNEQEEIVLLNRQALIQFGYARHRLTGQSVRVIIPDGLTDDLPADTPRTAPRRFERIARRKDGRVFPAEIIAGPAGGENGTLVTAAIRDITARKTAEAELLRKVEELNRSNMELAQFASIASHDLQEPLRMVASYTQLLARRYRGRLDADADKFIEFAVDGATRMQQLIQDLLAYSRVGAKGLQVQEISAETALETALISLGGAIRETGAVITHDALPPVMADSRQLAQLFQNLISNAIKYHGPAPPLVHVAAVRTGGRWLFSVRDHGIGIESQHFERIFGMFQRLHSREDFAGTGIGLAICKKIVEGHGGTITVESGRGEGAVFRFTLQAVASQP